MSIEHLLRDNFETVYKVHHHSKYGFGGNTTIWVAVEEETDHEITGRKFGPMADLPGQKVTIRKDNVAGWQADRNQYLQIPEEEPTPSEEDLKRAYMQDRIDVAELEESLEKAID